MMFDKFEIFKSTRGAGYELSMMVGDGWEKLFSHDCKDGLRATADILNKEWKAAQKQGSVKKDIDRVAYARWRRDQIFEAALQIGRLSVHSTYLEDGALVRVASSEAQGYVEHFSSVIKNAAKQTLLVGGWEDV